MERPACGTALTQLGRRSTAPWDQYMRLLLWGVDGAGEILLTVGEGVALKEETAEATIWSTGLKSSWLRRVFNLGAAIGTSEVLQLRATGKLQIEVSFIIERGGAQVASIGWCRMLESFLCREDEITTYFLHGVVHSAHYYVKMIGLES